MSNGRTKGCRNFRPGFKSRPRIGRGSNIPRGPDREADCGRGGAPPAKSIIAAGYFACSITHAKPVVHIRDTSVSRGRTYSRGPTTPSGNAGRSSGHSLKLQSRKSRPRRVRRPGIGCLPFPGRPDRRPTMGKWFTGPVAENSRNCRFRSSARHPQDTGPPRSNGTTKNR